MKLPSAVSSITLGRAYDGRSLRVGGDMANAKHDSGLERRSSQGRIMVPPGPEA